MNLPLIDDRFYKLFSNLFNKDKAQAFGETIAPIIYLLRDLRCDSLFADLKNQINLLEPKDFRTYHNEDWIDRFKANLCGRLDQINTRLKTRRPDFRRAISDMERFVGVPLKKLLNPSAFIPIYYEAIKPILDLLRI